MVLGEIGSLLIRVTIGVLFLISALACTSALKNLVLMAPTAYLALAGAEPMLIGFGPNGQLQGLLTRL